MVRSYGSVHNAELISSWRFQGNKSVPSRITFSYASLLSYDWRELESHVLQHRALFPEYIAGSLNPEYIEQKPWQKEGTVYTDSWGEKWKCTMDGITGTVVSHSLAGASDLDSFVFPDPETEDGWGKINWEEEIYPQLKDDIRRYGFCTGELRHGFLFLTLTYLRGYEQIMYDMYENSPLLHQLIAGIEKFNAGLVERYLHADPAVIFFPEDLGAQTGPLIMPEHFRSYLQPSYRRLTAQAKKQGALAYLHSDGDIRALADDLLASGFDVINIQDRVNGIDTIAELFKNKAAIDLDLDRQELTRTGSKQDISDWVREITAKLGTPRGGLSIVYDLYPGIPMENISAVMDALESVHIGDKL